VSLALASRRAAISPAWVKNPLWRTARAVPSLDLRFADTKSLTDAVTGQSLVTFTRASSGTYVGSDGVLRTAAVNEPRFDHNPTTGESLGLLVEEQRTNLLLQSNGFDTTWTNSLTTETANAGTAPDGTNTAWELKDSVDASASQHLLSQTPASFVSGTAYTFSVWAKSGTLSHVALTFPSTAFGSTLTTRYNLATGTAASVAAGTTATVTAFPGGWYRVTTSTTATASASGTLNIRLAQSGTASYQGDGTGTILIWGAQLEAGAFPTSYIPTTTATATRSADVASVTGTAFSSWYSQSEGTVFGDFIRTASTNSQQGRVFSFSDGTNTNQLEIYQTGGSNPSAQITVTTLQAQWTTSNFAIGVPTREVLGYQLNNTNASFNGSAEATDTVCIMPTALTQARIGDRQDGIRTLNGTIRRLCYWGQRLPDSILQAITQ